MSRNGSNRSSLLTAGAVLAAAGAAVVAFAPSATAKNVKRGNVQISAQGNALPTNDDFRFRPANVYRTTGGPNPCPADVTTTGAGVGDPGYGVPDGQVTGADINFYVNAWVAGDASIADVTTTGAGIGDPGYGVPDGQITGADINYYVNLWVAGCP